MEMYRGPEAAPSHTKMKSCICDESLYPALFLNAILFRIFENDQQSDFRLHGFSRLTHFQSGITVICLFYSPSYPICRSPADVSPPHPLVVAWGNLSVSRGDLHLSHAETIFPVHFCFLAPDCMLRVVAMELRRRH